MKYAILILPLCVSIACSYTQRQKEEGLPDAKEHISKNDQLDSISILVVANAHGGYGYDIYVEGTKIFSQPHPPGLPGVEGFKTKEQAQRVADLVVLKIKNGIMPPTVNRRELDSLGVEGSIN